MAKNSNHSIDQWVKAAQIGDAEAFGKIYDELVKPVYRYIYYRVNPQIAEDLTEETFLKAWKNLPKYKKTKHPFSAWVFRIAHNLICDYYRKNQPNLEIDEEAPDLKKESDPRYKVNLKLNQIKLRKAIKTLPEKYQQVIVLKYINEEDNGTIAKTIGKTEGAVRTIQFRALKKLKQLLLKKKEDF